MKPVLRVSLLAFLLIATASQCFALREILTVTRQEAGEMGIEVRARPAGTNAVGLELEFKPEGRLKDFTHVEMHMAGDGKSPVLFAELREKRSSSGSVIVKFTAGRAYFEKITLSVVMHSPGEAGDHACQLRLKDFVDLEKIR